MDSGVPGVNNLTELIDKRLLLVLRDGRRLYGILRSYDQFGNMVLTETIERLFVDLEYADENLGIFWVRGENVVMVGELDEEEFRRDSRRMARFKRSLEQLRPKYEAARQVEREERQLALELGATDMASFDYY